MRTNSSAELINKLFRLKTQKIHEFSEQFKLRRYIGSMFQLTCVLRLIFSEICAVFKSAENIWLPVLFPPTRSLAVRINPFRSFTNWRNSSSLICLPSRQATTLPDRNGVRESTRKCFLLYLLWRRAKVVSLFPRKSTRYSYSKWPQLVSFVRPLTMRQCAGSLQRKNLVNCRGNRKLALVWSGGWGNY